MACGVAETAKFTGYYRIDPKKTQKMTQDEIFIHDMVQLGIGFPKQLTTRSSSGSIGWSEFSESCHFKVSKFSQDENILYVEIVCPND